jgi:hypothetical protein
MVDLIKMKKKRVAQRRRVADGSRMVLHPARKLLAKTEFLALVQMVAYLHRSRYLNFALHANH